MTIFFYVFIAKPLSAVVKKEDPEEKKSNDSTYKFAEA